MMVEPMTDDEATDEISVDGPFNEHIYSNFFPRDLPLPPYAAPMVLMKIIVADPRLDQRYLDITEATTLVNKHEELRKAIFASWANGNIGKIRSSALLRARQNSGNLTPYRPELNAIRAAWEIPYVGKHHTLLLDSINEMKQQAAREAINARAPIYSNTVPIIQSSGTGKSRMVDEVAKRVFTIPFNIGEDHTSGFPWPDQSIRLFFTTKGDLENVQFRYTAFLDNLFRHVTALLDGLRQRPLAGAWYQHLKNLRPYTNDTNRALIFRKVVGATQGELSNTPWPTADDVKKTEERLKKNAAKLISRLNGPENVRPIKLLLYFDEAHPLTVAHSPTGGRSFYQVLCWVFDRLRNLPLFVIFLSTDFHLARLAPRKTSHPPNHMANSPSLLLDPITEMPFDCLPDNKPIAKTRELSLDLVSQPEFMVKFGRPLFWTWWEKGPQCVRDQIIHLAMTKLTREATGEGKYNENALLAILSTRVLLDFDASREEGRHVEQALVEGHMRIAYSVPAHREYVRAGTPSEPILAEAAAQAMALWSGVVPKRDVTAELLKLSKKGLIGKGERGEMVARFLLTLAHDQACVTSVSSSKPLFSSPIPVVDFLKALFSDKWSNRVLDSRPDNYRQGASLRDAFKHAYIRFTHFVKASDGSAVTTHGASAAVIRGFAFQCFDQQKTVDIVIPVVLTNGEQGTSMMGLGEEVMTGILISVKNPGSRISPTDRDIDAEKLNFFPPRCELVRPYIALTMELGVERNPVLATDPPADRTRQTQTIAEEPPQHPRYSVAVTGCSSEVYGCIHDNDTFAQLLASRDLLIEHPRQNLDSVLRLKPFFAYGNASYDWLDNPELSGIPISAPEGVRLGGEGGEEEDEEGGGGDVAVTEN